ncbi:MAG TPA: hypothetical protein VM187_16810, partial [Niastella sp.]|nr:hypothetical protein [Niastella sp.]
RRSCRISLFRYGKSAVPSIFHRSVGAYLFRIGIVQWAIQRRLQLWQVLTGMDAMGIHVKRERNKSS